jgi:very-short-patch-repair endonuclease
VLRFWNNDVLGNTEGVVSTVMGALRWRAWPDE